MPLLEVVGNTGAAEPLQIAGTALKVGTVFGFIVTVTLASVAHCPAFGVNVYDADTVLLTVTGNHVPVMPLVEVVGNTGAIDPLHIEGTAAKVGVVFELTVTISVVVVAHCPASGVNV
jgi:hypothetical protein